MSVGSGIASQVGFGDETTPGTAVTVDHFLPFTSESVNKQKTTLQGEGLRGGALFEQASARSISTVGAGGDVTVDVRWNRMLLLFKHMFGTVVSGPTVVSTAAYKTVFAPGVVQGKSFTFQKGVPGVNGTVVPMTSRGCKIPSWKLSVAMGQLLQAVLTVDGWDVTTATALAAASYSTANGVWPFAQVSALKIGGNPTTTSGVTSITGGTQVATVINSFELDATRGMKTDRYGLGSAGVKAEQIDNAFLQLTGSLGGEFYNRTEFWDLFNTDASTPLQITFTGPNVPTTAVPYSIDLVLPCVKFDTDEVSVGGPDVVGQSPTFKVLDNDVDNVAQLTVVSADTTI